SHYYEEKPFYTLAYGADIRKIQRRALLRFYAQPWRLWALLTRIPRKRDLLRNARPLAELMFSFVSRLRGKKGSGADYARSVEVANAF
ncbi:MAG: hypothetical protein K8I02_06835, partial [Candidatus Methylomirabilis sp.]|nr:hypothetical protein [Deltaproteobacteria bacterium]